MPDNATLEQRVAKLEKFLEKLRAIAETHPMGKMLLTMLDE